MGNSTENFNFGKSFPPRPAVYDGQAPSHVPLPSELVLHKEEKFSR